MDEVNSAPQGPVERALADIWGRLLHVERVGRHDNFFELGGQSVVAMGVLAEVAARLGVEPPLIMLFQYPTISEMAAALTTLLSEEQTQQSKPPLLTRAPLAFSQLAHWNLYRLAERRSVRQVAYALSLRGKLDIGALRAAISEVVRRHDALRTRVTCVEDIPEQEIDPPGHFPLEVLDLTPVEESRRSHVLQQQIEAAILLPIDVSRDSLLGVWLWRVQADEHVMLTAMEHMISDMASVDILLREVFTAYGQIVRGETLSLPPVTLQFPDYAFSQRDTHPQWLQRHGLYWEEHLRGCPRQRFSQDDSHVRVTSWDSVPLRIESSLKGRLHEWCRQQRTSPAIALFTAYAALVLRWGDVADTVVRYQGNGRSGRQTEHAIGFFASRLYLRLSISPDDSLLDLLRQVTQEYCRAYEHDDASYLETRTPAPACDRNSFFNYIPQGTPVERFLQSAAGPGLQIKPVPFANPWVRRLTWDNEPMAMIFEGDNEISGAVYYPAGRLTRSIMERFVRYYLVFLESLLTRPKERIPPLPGLESL